MTPQEVAALLTAAAAVDDRIDPDAARVQAWHAILLPDCPFEFARDALVEHYRERRDCLMPADVNVRWVVERKARAEQARQEQQRREIEASSQDAVPMPEHVRALFATFRARSSVNNGA